MGKIFSKIATLSVGLALAVGVAVASNKRVVPVHADDSCVVSMADEAENKSWSNGVAYTSWVESTKGIFTFTANGGGNNGKYYTSDSSWRMYNGGNAVISCDSSYEITSVTSSPSATWNVAANKLSATASFTATVKLTSVTINYQEGSGVTYYGVTYDANGATSGTVPTDSTSYESGDIVTVKGNTGNLAKTGYIFGGWNTSADGNGTNYAAGTGTFEITENITLYAKWNADTLDSLSLSGSMTKTSYKVGDEWDPAGFIVTADYESGNQVDVTNDVEWSYNPASALSTSITSVVATASFGGQNISSSAQNVTVTEGVTYDLTKINGFSSWTNSYTNHSVSSSDVGASVSASMAFSITNKQGSGVGSTYPCIGAKTESELECLAFTLNQSGKKITSVDIVFVARYTTTYPSLYLHKGSGIASSPLATLTMSGAQASEHTLSIDNLNDTVFTVGYNAHQTGSNGAVGIKSISIGLADQASFGTVDHISVTTQPNTVYHVGETFDATGMVVKAFDGVDESTANFIDVTGEVTTQYRSGIYVFDDDNVPGGNMWIEYTDEDTNHFYTDLYLSVYALAEYELVTSALEDWSGQYLIVGTDYNSDLVAMNGGLANPDVPGGYKVVSDTDGVISTGQELEWTIAAVAGGYSIQGKSGKYIGSLTAASNGMLVSETALVNTLSYSDDAVSVAGTNGYGLKLYNEASSSRFRYYSGGKVQLYKLKSSDKVETYAQLFLETLSTGAGAVCQYDESTQTVSTDLAALRVAWKSLAEQYASGAGLSAAEKEEFRLGVANKDGTTNLAKALALYDHIATAYGTKLHSEGFDNYNFMNRGIIPASTARLINMTIDNSAVAIIVIISLASVAAFGCYFLLKKKRFHR